LISFFSIFSSLFRLAQARPSLTLTLSCETKAHQKEIDSFLFHFLQKKKIILFLFSLSCNAAAPAWTLPQGVSFEKEINSINILKKIFIFYFVFTFTKSLNYF
jgi:hypothetical protein